MTSKTAIRVASRKEKGGTPEDARHEVNRMEAVAKVRPERNVIPADFNVVSDNRKLGIWLDKLVQDSLAKGKPVAQMVKLTPELASVLLDRNPANRKINETAVERYAYEIMGNSWVFNGEPMIVSDTGELNDGQHRCAAVIKSGKPIDVILIVGVPRATRTTLDQGRARTAGDYLSMEGHHNTNILAAAAQHAWQFQNYGMLNPRTMVGRATKSEVLKFVEVNPGLRRSLEMFSMKNSRGLGGQALLGFCHYAIGQVGRPEDVDNFFIALIEGVNLGRGHPALYVRTRMLSLIKDRDTNAKAELIFRAWNAWRKGQKLDKVWLQGGVLPTLER